MTNLSSVAVVITGSVDAGSFTQLRFAIRDSDRLSIDTVQSRDDAFDGTMHHEVMRAVTASGRRP